MSKTKKLRNLKSDQDQDSLNPITQEAVYEIR